MAIIYHGKHRVRVTWADRAARWQARWRRFWFETTPEPTVEDEPRHETGASLHFADTLRDIPNLTVHDTLAADTGRYAMLMAAPVISGDVDLAELTAVAELTTVDGWSLCGSLLDQTGGAV